MEDKEIVDVLKRILVNMHISVEMAKEGKMYYAVNKMNGVVEQLNKLATTIESDNDKNNSTKQ